MNPILMSLSSVQSLTHDHRAKFDARFRDLVDGVDTRPVAPKGLVGRLTALLSRSPLPSHEAMAIGLLATGR